MYCVRCGHPVDDGDGICAECGMDLRPFIKDAAQKSYKHVAVPGKEGDQPSTGGRPGWLTLVLSILLIGLVVLFEVFGVVFASLFSWDLELPVILSGALGATLCVVILGGKKLYAPAKEEFVYAWKQGWWVVAVSFGLMVLEVGATIAAREQLVTDNWQIRMFSVLLLCLCVGVSEEALFRGMLLGGMLDAFGKSKRGIVIGITVIAVLFGAAHVDWMSLEFGQPLEVIQAILKTMQTGTYGFFLACVVAKTGNLWGAIILHALDDYLLMIPSICFLGESPSTNYVASGDAAMENIMAYVVVTLLYLPLVWKGVRMLGTISAPQRGALHKEPRASNPG